MNLNPLSKINKDIKELKRQIKGPEKEADSLIFRTLYFWNSGEYVPKTLKEELEAQDKRIDEIGKSFKNLLTHLKMELVKIISDEDGTRVDDPKWCLGDSQGGAPVQLCTGQVYGYGEGAATFETKQVGKFPRHGCGKCQDRIRYFKAIKIS